MKNRRAFSTKNEVKLICNGEEFIKTNLELIQSAKQFIILQTYILELDDITTPLIEALINKAIEGVQVNILVDGYGSRDFPLKQIEIFKNHGIHFDFFSPMFTKKMEHIGRRLHSKILMIDGQSALVGGINLSQRFNAPPNARPWLDFSCVITGEEVYHLIQRNLNLYWKYFPAFMTNHLILFQKYHRSNYCQIRTNINDWMRLKDEIYLSYLHAIKKATKQIVLVAPYFFPGKRFLKELARASKRGVCVDLIFSAQSDHPIERWSSRYLYGWFLSHKINIYEWEESIVHGKLALIDHDWVTIGSYNHNFLSRFGNHELNLEIVDKNFNQAVQLKIDELRSKSFRITMERWQQSNTFKQRTMEFLSYLFANFLTIISMILIIRRQEKTDFNLID
jgi:cardiolipin synthase A/B